MAQQPRRCVGSQVHSCLVLRGLALPGVVGGPSYLPVGQSAGTGRLGSAGCQPPPRRGHIAKAHICECGTWQQPTSVKQRYIICVHSALVRRKHTLRPSSKPGPRKDLIFVRLALSKEDLKMSLMPTLTSVTPHIIRRSSPTLGNCGDACMISKPGQVTQGGAGRKRAVSMGILVCDLLDLGSHGENVLFGLDNIRST
eukprot:scaffold1098_cov417-Prasinococcus_capsulatus_cf.AAC.5